MTMRQAIPWIGRPRISSIRDLHSKAYDCIRFERKPAFLWSNRSRRLLAIAVIRCRRMLGSERCAVPTNSSSATNRREFRFLGPPSLLSLAVGRSKKGNC